jgi:hypothetical protein
MKQILITIAILFSFTLYGQETNTPTTTQETNKLLIGFNFSPDVGYNLSNDYKPTFVYTTGINLNYNISKYIDFEIGTQYSKKGYNKITTLDWSVMFPSANSPYWNLQSNEFKTTFKYHYIDIPVRAIFSSGKSKIQFVTSVGITTNILIKASVTSIYHHKDGSKERDTYYDNIDHLKKVNITPTISAGIAYQISDKLKLNIEPTQRFGLFNTRKYGVKNYLWSTGLNITCYYTLK